jgi:2-dehydro-3-deoxyphosphogluconate aldolase/(4S)-4-hydroxy-2-oxoglutarate aldolase
MLAALTRYKIIPALDIKDLNEDTALKICESLIKANLPVMEIPFRRHSDSLVLKAIAKEFPNFLIGASGILNSEQLLRAVSCKVKFTSAPGLCPKTLKTAISQKIAFMPGAITPTEIQTLLNKGVADFQLFPLANQGGVDYFKNTLKPFEHLPLDIFVKGEISLKQANEYLQVPHVSAVVLGDIILQEHIVAEKWDKISAIVTKALEYVNK